MDRSWRLMLSCTWMISKETELSRTSSTVSGRVEKVEDWRHFSKTTRQERKALIASYGGPCMYVYIYIYI